MFDVSTGQRDAILPKHRYRVGCIVIELEEPECLSCGALNMPPTVVGKTLCFPCLVNRNLDGSEWSYKEWREHGERITRRIKETMVRE